MPVSVNFPYGKLIFFVTRNVNKFNEARRVLAEYSISVAMVKAKTLEIQDDSIEKIAEVSALNASREIELPIIVEDAGLFIEALKGFPGPYSSYVYRTIGVNGILKLLEGIEERRAYFKSAVAFCSPDGEIKCFQGIVYGRITREVRGSGGFGFDPIFEPDEEPNKTFAEMTIEEKNRFSHRARAFRKFAEWYKKTYLP
ncbi:MAG: XTP/dITP diphosphatase [Candidatus Bathyarchaeia archaeon]|nr:XTP/dITP diphosphatase [Candidatus Bathyarchaeota archaeon]